MRLPLYVPGYLLEKVEIWNFGNGQFQAFNWWKHSQVGIIWKYNTKCIKYVSVFKIAYYYDSIYLVSEVYYFKSLPHIKEMRYPCLPL